METKTKKPRSPAQRAASRRYFQRKLMYIIFDHRREMARITRRKKQEFVERVTGIKFDNPW